LVLTGFERYAQAGFGLARLLSAPPWPACGRRFTAPDKLGQRTALAAAQVRQPAWQSAAGPGQLRFPQVVKPVDGGGGLHVVRVDNQAQRDAAIRRIRAAENYGGGAFDGILVEEFVPGTEFSVQGIAVAGQPTLLACCEKIVVDEPDAALCGFREAAHIARHGGLAPAGLVELAADCLAATGYLEGPFHLDAIGNAGGFHFVEMGFRLSGGGLVALVDAVTGSHWAEAVFAVHLDGQPPAVPPTPDRPLVVGQVTVTAEEKRRLGEPADLEWIAASTTTERPPAGDLSVLASDRQRHTGFVGRLVARGHDVDEVRERLSACIPERLGRQPCAG
jgi:biotin carboxylase